jgi:uncharacterized protein with FMN-binding domain
MPSNRMPRGLVALSASAVAAIYLAGYVRTQSADAGLAPVAGDIPIATTTAVTPTPIGSTAAPPRSVAAPATAVPPSATSSSSTATTSTATTSTATTSTATTAPAQAVSSTVTSAQQTTSQSATGYTDGTYTGQGTSRRGDVWVQVQVTGGRIANVTITRSTLQYPLRDIAALPQQVVQRQSAQVDLVSRATYSSQAFRGAVSQALASAVAG